MRLTPKKRAELLNELRLRVLFRDKVLCRRYGISRSTLSRLQAEVLREPMTQYVSYTVRALLLNGNGPQKVKAAA